MLLLFYLLMPNFIYNCIMFGTYERLTKSFTLLFVCLFVFNVPPTAKVTLRWGLDPVTPRSQVNHSSSEPPANNMDPLGAV